MTDIFQLQPDGTLRGPLTWDLFIGWTSDPGSTPITRPVSFADATVGYTPTVPQAPTLVATQTSRTTATLAWTAAPGFTGPPILEWEVQVRSSTDNGVNFSAWAAITGSPFAADVFTANPGTLATGTPEIIFEYRARGNNGDGNGDWSPTAGFQWNGTVTTVPNRPTNLVGTVQSDTSILYTWTAANGAATDGATKQGLWQGNVNLNIDIDKNATSFLRTGLSPGTAYTNINVRRFNSAGWSGGSNWIDTTTSRTRTTVDDPVMGQSVPDNQSTYRTSIPAIRVYNSGDVIPRFNAYSPRVIAYTDDPFSNGGQNGVSMAYVTHVQQMLDSFYNGDPQREACETHVAYGNEISTPQNWPNPSTISQALIDVYAALRDLIWGTTGGVRDYPKVSLWIDMTANSIRSEAAGPRFKPLAKYLDGFACSMYPAGRTISTGNPLIEYDPDGYPTGSIWTGNPRNRYSYYIDPVFATLADWRADGGVGGTSLKNQLNQFATWEVGIPIHHSLSGDGLASYVRTGTTPTDITQRPRYLVGGARVTGPASEQYNFQGFLNYIHAKCDAEDVSMREQLYWNQQDNPQIPNVWYADRQPLTNPDSVTAWYQWSPGYRLPDF